MSSRIEQIIGEIEEYVDSCKSVSYTHLDVYKRQLYSLLCGNDGNFYDHSVHILEERKIFCA